jgi:hypothetical protein
MNTRSYFTNLISSDLSDPVDYAASQSENMELPAFYGFELPDDTPPLDEVPTVDDAHAAGKEKKGQKNSMLKRTNFWCQHGLMYHKMQFKELIKQKVPTGAEFINTSIQTRRLILITLKFLS